MPLPGGLGALEASQVFALGAFGISAASRHQPDIAHARARHLERRALGYFLRVAG